MDFNDLRNFADVTKASAYDVLASIDNWRICKGLGATKHVFGSKTVMKDDTIPVYINIQMDLTAMTSPAWYFEARDNDNNVLKEVRWYENVNRSDVLRYVLKYFAQDKEHKEIMPGEMISFGNYRGMPINWNVVRVEGDYVCLFASSCIDEIRFSDHHLTAKRWEDSKLRAFLNGDFYNEHFSDKERESIVLHKTVNNKYQSLSKKVSAGRSTMDYIVAPSYKEIAEMNFGINVLANGGVNSWYLNNSYWLRTPGRTKTWQNSVSRYSLAEDCRDTARRNFRPMMWVRKDSYVIRKYLFHEDVD